MKSFNKIKLEAHLGAVATVAVLWVATLNAQVVDTTTSSEK